MENPTRKTHPMILVAATAVTITSFAALASMAGWLPDNQDAPTAPVARLAMAAPTVKPAILNTPSGSSITADPAEERPARRAAAPRKVAAPVSTPPSTMTSALPPRPAPTYDTDPGYGNRGATPVSHTPDNNSGIYAENSRQAPSLCRDCGTVESIREIAQEGEGSGLGAVAGGVIGGLLGSLIGNGSGRKVATVAGVVGGAYAGHTVEKKTRGTEQFEITVRLDDGSMRTIKETQKPAWRAGDRVRINNEHITSI